MPFLHNWGSAGNGFLYATGGTKSLLWQMEFLHEAGSVLRFPSQNRTSSDAKPYVFGTETVEVSSLQRQYAAMRIANHKWSEDFAGCTLT